MVSADLGDREGGLRGKMREMVLVRTLAVTASLVVSFALGESKASDDRQPASSRLFQVTLKKKDEDRLTTQGDAGSVTFEVTSKSGIGEATVRRLTPTWPKKIVLRLHLRGLEQLSILNESEKVAFRASVQSHGDRRRILQVSRGETTDRVEVGSPYFVEIGTFDEEGHPTGTIPLKAGFFQLEIPAAMFKGNPEQISIRWIDFYRS